MAIGRFWTRLDDEQRFALVMVGLSVLIFLAVRRAERRSSE